MKAKAIEFPIAVKRGSVTVRRACPSNKYPDYFVFALDPSTWVRSESDL